MRRTLELKLQESELITQIRDTIRRFATKEITRDLTAEWDRKNYFPRDVFVRLADLGLMGLAVPEEYGGMGRDISATIVAIEELSRHSLALAVPYIMASCYAGMNIEECGTEEQKQAILPKVVEGSMLFAYGWTEPDVGADLASVKTRAERNGDSVIVNGTKRFCSGAAISDIIYTLVRSGPESDRHRNLTLLLIPSNAAGVTIAPIESMGMKGAATADVMFDNVVIPAENIVGGASGWNRAWEFVVGPGLNVEKLEVAAMAFGIAGAALDDAWEYARERSQFGKTISNYQSIQHKLADMVTQLHAARLVLYQATALANDRIECGLETSMAKLFVTESAKSIVLECQTIFGAYGYVKDFKVERYVRDILLMPIIGGSSAIQKNNVFKLFNKFGLN